MKKPKKIKLNIKNSFDRYGKKKSVFLNIPGELIPTFEHINKYLECADYKEKNYFKLKVINEEKGYVIVINENGAWQTFTLDQVCLHRNEGVRNQDIDTDTIIRNAMARRRAKKK